MGDEMGDGTNDEHWRARWVAGPSCAHTYVLMPGRHLLGRAPGTSIRVDDPDVEPHHAVIEATSGGGLTITQLTGRLPIRVGDDPVDGPTPLIAGALVQIGSGTLLLEWVAAPTHRPVGTAIIVGRRPRLDLARHPLAPVHPPELLEPAPRHPLPVVPVLCTSAITGLVAVVVHQPMLAMFAVLGAIGSVVTAAVQLASVARARRRTATSNATAIETFRAQLGALRAAARLRHCDATVDVARAVSLIDGSTPGLWERRSHHPDAFDVALGVGSVDWSPPVEGGVPGLGWGHLVEQAARLDDVAVPVRLGSGRRIAITGEAEAGAALGRALIVQLAAVAGPADWRLVVVASAAWSWLEGLPHHVASPDAGDASHVVILTDDGAQLVAPDSVVRRLLGSSPSACLVALLPGDAELPAICTSMIEVGARFTGRWSTDVADPLGARPARVAGISVFDALGAMDTLTDRIDPEDPRHHAPDLPATVSLAALVGDQACDASAIADRWHRRPAHEATPSAVIGTGEHGDDVEIDLDRDGPHALIAGTTGSGKSELLRSWVLAMALRTGPQHLNFVLVDYKGGAAFDACARLPHVVGIVTDLDGRLAERALRSLRAELRRREQLLRDRGAGDLAALLRSLPEMELPRLVVVIDEFAALAAELPGFLDALIGIAQRGRSLGIHLVLARRLFD